ncbi:hypothetical protein SAMN05216404_10980 [Nitrosospira multiformis]|uniref:Uncharacterized protein n=1 Tax=Nitrosospira multiformis TaxID=1231 RepID=A0A1H8KVV3_9PROT|nr:hypothetical protein SAMN05216404_10980 [Nitrosospira multiformis]
MAISLFALYGIYPRIRQEYSGASTERIQSFQGSGKCAGCRFSGIPFQTGLTTGVDYRDYDHHKLGGSLGKSNDSPEFLLKDQEFRIRETPLIPVPVCHRGYDNRPLLEVVHIASHGLGFCPSHPQVLSDQAIEGADGDTSIPFLAIYGGSLQLLIRGPNSFLINRPDAWTNK